MDKERIKLIVRNLESLVNCLKEELYYEESSFENFEEVVPYINESDVDEYYDDRTDV